MTEIYIYILALTYFRDCSYLFSDVDAIKTIEWFYAYHVFVIYSRPLKKNFVEVTELTDITYTSNLVKLRPGHMNVVLVLTDASKNVLLSKFAKEVYSFTG